MHATETTLGDGLTETVTKETLIRQDSGEVGCAFVIPDLGITRRYKLNAGLSIFSAEMYAILMACTFVNDMPNPPLGVVILWDADVTYYTAPRYGNDNAYTVDGSASAASNYCRIFATIDNYFYVWCYHGQTEDRYDNCDVEECVSVPGELVDN
nr:hypothetical protein BaRGS_016296 [Batillaria attramentaria]